MDPVAENPAEPTAAPAEPTPAEPMAAPTEPTAAPAEPAPHQDFTIVITRHELYPREAPHAVVIGFTITCNCNGRNMYIDTQVPLSSIAQGTSDEDIAATAWNRVKDSVKGWCDDVKSKGSLLNKAFVPPSFV